MDEVSRREHPDNNLQTQTKENTPVFRVSWYVQLYKASAVLGALPKRRWTLQSKIRLGLSLLNPAILLTKHAREKSTRR